MLLSVVAALLGTTHFSLADHGRTGASGQTGAAAIDTIVVVMMENRAFDHMLGYMSRGGPFGDTRVDGLNGTECNAKSLQAGGPCTQTPYSTVCANATAAAAAGIVCANDKAADRCESVTCRRRSNQSIPTLEPSYSCVRMPNVRACCYDEYTKIKTFTMGFSSKEIDGASVTIVGHWHASTDEIAVPRLTTARYDPDHTHHATTERIFGCKYVGVWGVEGLVPCSVRFIQTLLLLHLHFNAWRSHGRQVLYTASVFKSLGVSCNAAPKHA